MSHFADEAWADLVRDLAGARQKQEMQKHLDSSCAPCLEACNFWSRVWNLAKEDRQVDVPDDLVKAAQARFSLLEMTKSSQTLVPEVVFDSHLQVAGAGLRSSAASCRQLMYRTGSLCIDVRMEAQPQRDKISLVGQVQDSARAELAAVPVSLVEGSRTVVATETNSMGEFHMEFDRCNKLSISIGLQGKVVVMPLPPTPWEKHGD